MSPSENCRARQEDEARAGSEDGLAAAVELRDGGREVPRIHELQQGRGLAPGDDEPLDGVELGRLSHLDRLDTALCERPGVEREVALEGEDPDPHRE